ncbi:glycosyl hydrolase family 18 protein [Phosphitispora sp. TUW77]|uniref:glycosyl hydrolase family 18 protein n=1 Tax=Phosphitispora sp. TUW77 TaxID=3152361 RepID=UPI003AB5D286
MQDNRKIRFATLIYFLIFSMLFLATPQMTCAAQQSRSAAAKGKGFVNLVREWNDRYLYSNGVINGKEILGYYTKDWATDTLSQTSLENNIGRITTVAAFSYVLTSSGEITGESPTEALETAKANNIEIYALVHNLTKSGFDRTLIHNVLSNSELSVKAVDSIYRCLVSNGFDGVNIDFENVPSGDRQDLNDFMTLLKKKLAPQGLKVTISVPAKTSDNINDGWSGAFDYEYLGGVADRIMLMTYDEHWIGGAPGPVASEPWVKNVITYSSVIIPRDKILLGIGNYGYDWIVGKGGCKAVPANSALALAEKYGAVIEWDSYSQTPYFYYWENGQKHVVWFESPESAAFKMNLVNDYDLKGVALWRLGFESWEFWDKVDKKLI